MTVTNPSFRRILKARRLKQKLSQAELARLSGKTQAQTANFERGASDLRLSSLTEISRALGCELVLVPVRLLPVVRGLIEDRPASYGRLVGNDPEEEEEDRE